MIARPLVAVVGAAWLVAAAMACGQQSTDEQAMPARTVQDVLRQHTDSLMALTGVVGTAQGECDGKPCIKVYLVESSPDLVKQIPSVIEGYKVEIQVTGEIRALKSE